MKNIINLSFLLGGRVENSTLLFLPAIFIVCLMVQYIPKAILKPTSENLFSQTSL